MRGNLRILLGAAPGVGKTYLMLEEGHRLSGQGVDVVIGLVETHGRAQTAAVADGLELIPRRRQRVGTLELTEMDVPAILARRPQVVLVDELAHTNVAGSPHEKRWQDVEELLQHGLDVITTMNVQHIESLGDVVRSITGVTQQETVPDPILRSASQIEVVDLTPQALRERLSEGHVYPAERVDAALANYFRLGNLTALREIALLWLADEVDTALQTYRTDHNIEQTWQARERVVVALTSGPEGETLLRRGARIAARSAGGELLAVHVTNADGLRTRNPESLVTLQSLVEELGGQFHRVVGDDVGATLVEFARSANATQLVIGTSRRGWITKTIFGPGVGTTVIRNSGDIDVHIVTHAAAGRTPRRRRRSLLRARGALTLKRQLWGFALLIVGAPLLTWALVSSRTSDSITSDVLFYQLLVVVIALVGGMWPALLAALVSGVALNYFLVEPVESLTVSTPRHALALFLYVIIAILVSFVVDKAARQTRGARRAQAESELMSTIAGSILRGDDALEAIVTQTKEAFSVDDVRVVMGQGSGAPSPDSTSIAVGTRGSLELSRSDLTASERRLLAVIAAQIDAALEHSDLTRSADAADQLAQTDKVRSALLSAVGHDLRRPLASATAAVGGLRLAGSELSAFDRAELLQTAEESLESLASLVTNLLDVGRLQAGALGILVEAHDVDGTILPALDELGVGPGDIELDLHPEMPLVMADPALLSRVVVNLLDNALRFSPAGTRVRIATSWFGDTAQIRIVDHGPGIAEPRREAAFVPFQRLGDTDNSTGLGLGLALSKGFTEGMGGTLEPEDTPGGGLTMVVSLPLAVAFGPVQEGDTGEDSSGR